MKQATKWSKTVSWLIAFSCNKISPDCHNDVKDHDHVTNGSKILYPEIKATEDHQNRYQEEDENDELFFHNQNSFVRNMRLRRSIAIGYFIEPEQFHGFWREVQDIPVFTCFNDEQWFFNIK
jgi:hypothetical protein